MKKYVCSLSPLCLNLITQSVMIRHAEILNAFKSRFDIDPPPEVDQDLTYLKMILIKACDVSNEIRPPAVAEPWVERLLQEYFVQVCISIMNATLHFTGDQNWGKFCGLFRISELFSDAPVGKSK